MRALSIRLRLTLLYFTFFSAAGLLLSAATWLLLEHGLNTLMMHELDERMDDLRAVLASYGPNPDPDMLSAELMRDYRLKDDGKWLEIVSDDGRWVYYSSRSKIANPIPSPPNQTGTLIPFVTERRHSLRTLSRVLQVDGHCYMVSMAISGDMSVKILVRFRRDLWLMVPVVFLAAAGVGHFLGRRALAPVQAIVTEVREISDRNLSRRLSVSTARDELSQLSETLNQMLARIDIAFRSVRSITANASHELRTPLSLIRTRVEIALCFPRTAEEYSETLREIQTETVWMTALIEKLLALARLDSGTAQPELQPVDVSALLYRTAREWKLTAEQLRLDLQVQEPVAAVHVIGNQTDLERLLRMLVDNACRYTEAGGTVRLGVDRDAGHVSLWVRDTGIGISEEEMPRIFDRFYRGRRSQGLQRGGSGLGLSLARWIAEQHKGTITVNSVPGEGSCFRVAFPEHTATARQGSVA
ncbi:sensor histidine kinase [Paracidobacterium acidisoli]|uniref:histidine kinase n=1 Tax=Paracidobacterium acidisoli TaxID=2303751 RepID=A0A372IJZ1_9BACT|nr:ATP-binding protein [Paracidobacterium acidisoli]MBT9333083.1 HAMP domain-containing protein [Paracidobacterium acidisoli]